MDNTELYNLAIQAREHAWAGFSGFRVGAALLTEDGRVFQGCNIEDPSGIGITNICAERCAVVKAVSEGCESFEKIAVAGGRDELEVCTPCGACRQYLQSWSPDIKVIVCDEKNSLKELTLSELLPYSFNL